MLIILGAQRLKSIDAPGAPKTEHLAVLEMLIARGLPLDLPDIGGFTALHHCVGYPMQDKGKIMRKLLSSGADVNYQNRWGSTPLHNAIMRGDSESIETLMEYGASIDIPDGNGYTVKSFYLKAGPVVNAAMEKWLRKRSGQEEAPMTEKRCDKCGIAQKSLKTCSGCGTVQYCSKECQRKSAIPPHIWMPSSPRNSLQTNTTPIDDSSSDESDAASVNTDQFYPSSRPAPIDGYASHTHHARDTFASDDIFPAPHRHPKTGTTGSRTQTPERRLPPRWARSATKRVDELEESE
ncbi:hypothetical protein NMY22_g7459 [Coprinellus aureogranulatus]|nr:hypothetical protein NMY22_g7459 [Coprinellus aureogranulatus]